MSTLYTLAAVLLSLPPCAYPSHTRGYYGDVAAITAVLTGGECETGQGGGHVIVARTWRMYIHFHYIDAHDVGSGCFNSSFVALRQVVTIYDLLLACCSTRTL